MGSRERIVLFALNVGFPSKQTSSKIARGVRALALLVASAAPGAAVADSAFVTQIAGAPAARGAGLAAPVAAPSVGAPTPEFATPRTRGGNLAQSLTVGSYNSIAQIQGGANDKSAVGILGGRNDKVNVIQAGSGQQSGVLLLNTQGLRINLLQPPGAPPFGLIIAHLPNGGWLVRH
jgi:hypothetical protein